MENEELAERTQREILLVAELGKGKIFLVKTAVKCALLIILSPFLCESQVVFFLDQHFVYLNSENKQKA